MSPQIVEALGKLQLLEQATVRLNGQQQAAAGGAHAHATAHAELAEKAGLSARALEAGAEAGQRFGEELVSGAARMGASLISFELIVQTIEKVTEAAREAEVANRQLVGRFGEAAGEYREFSEQAAQGTNFTAIAFERAAAALQPLTRDYGLTNEQLQALLRTTADLAAANGVSLVQAAGDVAGVMRGQTRAGAELGLNIRANVIAGMDDLTEAEKRAAVEGDNVASAHARLRVIELQAAEAHGQAAEAAGETGDQFARLDKATADLYETLAKAPVIRSLADDLGTAATSGANLIRIMERLNELEAEAPGRNVTANVGAGFLEGAVPALAAVRVIEDTINQQRSGYEALLAHRTAVDSLRITSAEAIGLTGRRVLPTPFDPGAAPRMDQAIHANETAVRSLTSAEAELARKTDDYAAAVKETASSGADLFTRHTQGADDIATAWTRAQIEVNRYELQLKQLQTSRSQSGGLEQQLVADRTLRRQLGLPELPGETAAIRELLRVGYKTQLAEGPAALAAALAHLKLGDWDASRVAVEHQDVTVGSANIVVQNGAAAGGGGRQSSISARGLPAGGRYGAARGPWDPATMGIGRAIG